MPLPPARPMMRPLTQSRPALRRGVGLCLCAALGLGLGLAGCTELPDLNDRLQPGAARADYPALVPVEPLLARAEASQQIDESTGPALEARVARLRARAAGLRGAVVDGASRNRIRQGVDRSGL